MRRLNQISGSPVTFGDFCRVGSGRVESWVSETDPVSHPVSKFYLIFAFND